MHHQPEGAEERSCCARCRLAGDPRSNRGHEPVFKQYHSIKPYLVNDTPPPEKRPAVARRPRGARRLYECILCLLLDGLSVVLVEPDKFVGARRIAAAYRSSPTRRSRGQRRLDNLKILPAVRCHTIMNCVDVCPKGLNPTRRLARSGDAGQAAVYLDEHHRRH